MYLQSEKRRRFKIEIKLSFFFRKSAVDTKGKTQSSQGWGHKDEPLPSALFKIYKEYLGHLSFSCF